MINLGSFGSFEIRNHDWGGSFDNFVCRNCLELNVYNLARNWINLDILDNGKEVLTLEEAAKIMGMARSTLYKMTCEQSIPFYRPNGKMIFFEKADILAWIRRNRVSTQEEIG